MTPRHVGIAGLAGLALGTAIAMSPAGVAAVVILGGLIGWTARPLHGVERRWVIGWLTLACMARVAVVGALPLLVNPRQQSFATPFGGDAVYLIQRSIWIANTFVRVPIAPRDFIEAFGPNYGRSAYNQALALLHVFFGPSPYAAHLVSTVQFFAAAVVLFRCVRSTIGPVAAFLGLAILTSHPTLFVWSVAPLKEAPFFILAAIAVRATLSLLQPSRWWHVPVSALVIGAAIGSMEAIRPGSGKLTAVALVAGVIGWMALQTRRTAVVAVVVGLIVVAAVSAWPRAGAVVADVVHEAARRHQGFFISVGHSFGLLDPDTYGSGGVSDRGAGAMTRFLIRGTTRFFSAPEPWILRPGIELLVIPQQMIWYALLCLAAVGAIAGFRRDPLLTALLSGFVIVGAAAIGVDSGNIGTFIRHRDTVVPCAIWLSAIGGAHALAVPRIRRFNPLDSGIAIGLLVLIPLGFALFVLFRTPEPRIDAVEPAVVSSPGELVLRGEHLRPFLHAYVSNRNLGTRIRGQTRDAYPPEAAYFAKNGREALLKLPALPPALYDLELFDGGDQVAYAPRAFTIGTTLTANPVAVVRVAGRFIGVDKTRAPVLVAGATIAPNDGTPLVEVLQIGADSPQLSSSLPGGPVAWVRIEGQSERPATLKLRCQYAENICFFEGRRVAPGQELPLAFSAFTVTFRIGAVVPDDPRWPLTGGPTKDAVVDFVGWPGAQSTLRAGLHDAGSPFEHPVRPAEIVRIVAVEPFVGDAMLDGARAGDGLFTPQPLVRIRAIVRYPLLPSGDVENRGRSVGPGSRVDFETAGSLLRGTITGFAPSAEARQP
jgi:hypothetical protein